MSGSLLWLLLTIKHVLLAHVIDFGYSQARSSTSKWSWLGLVGWLAAELSVSTVLLLEVVGGNHYLWLLAELATLTCTCLLDRKAPLTRLLVTHVKCELAVLVVYVLIAWGVTR